MAMSKKHYEAIAAIIDKHNTGEPVGEFTRIENLIWALSDYFSNENPNFSPQKFEDACNVQRNELARFGYCDDCRNGKHGLVNDRGACKCCGWAVA